MTDLEPKLARRRRLARLAILFEEVWVGIWPALGLAGLFLCVALLELPQALPPLAHAALLAVVGLGLVALLAKGLWRLRLPSRSRIDRRLERSSGLAHRPLAVLTDRPAMEGAEPLWQAHLARTMAQIQQLKVGWPKPGMAARDRRSLRGGLVVALAAALIIAGPETPSRIASAMSPGFPAGAASPETLVQAWITPPAYTAIAPIFLKPDTPTVSLPAGSHLTVSVTGGAGQPSLLLDGRSQPFQPLDAGSFQADRDLTAGGRLIVRRHGRDIAAWNLTAIADSPPIAAFSEPPGPASRGLQIRLPWRTSDDYGVVTLQVELRLRDRAGARPLVTAIPLPGGTPKTAHGIALEDLTASPWAGLPVTARLVARDAPGQEGHSEDAAFDLPERQFKNPVSRALVAVRKMLALHPDNRTGAIRELDRISNDFDPFAADFGAYLNLRDIASLLFRNADPAAVDEAQGRLWQLALHMEESSTERTARALERAREALRDAMQRDANGEHVDPKELDRLMQALQQALAEHLQALAEQAQRDHTPPPLSDGQKLDAHDLDRMAQDMRDAARDGKMDDAREKLAELEKMLDALKNARPEAGQRQNAQQPQKGRQQMGALQDMVQRQGGLLDHSQQRNTADSDSRQPRQDPSAANQTQDQRQTEQRVQQALRRALGELMQQFGDLTGKIPPSLGEADSAMRDAGQALGQGNDAGAAAGEQKAIEALQKGGREMGQQMAKQFGRQPGQGQPGQGQQGDQGEEADGDGDDGFSLGGTQLGSDQSNRPGPNRSGSDPREGRRDPLGRLMQDGTGGRDQNADVQVPDQMEQARTRAIQDELRRRGGDRERPQPELDYIDRLLKQF